MQKNHATLWRNAKIFTMTDAHQHHVIEQGAIVTQENRIQWVGSEKDIPKAYLEPDVQKRSLNGKTVTPGLIDCHTHVVYGGQRVEEFTQKLEGMSYEAILKQGGGIYSTVKATRALTEQALYDVSVKRIKQFLTQGVTTVEIKSGYGLDYETERKMLRIARAMGQILPIHISTTFLGAHVLAPEFKDKSDYIYFLTHEVLPKLEAENLVDAVDGFCDEIAFSKDELTPLFQKAAELKLGIKVHSDQLTSSMGGQLASSFNAWSADHLEFVDESSLAALAQSGTVAVLLPGAYYYLQAEQKPPIALLRKYGIPLALATDCNPGSSPCLSLLTILNMGCVLFRMTPFEAFSGVTRHAAKALGLKNKKGQLRKGFDADFVVWDIEHPDELAYYLGANPCLQVICKGETAYDATK